MRSQNRTVRLPCPVLDAIETLRQPGHPFADYPSVNAALVGLLRYAIAFPRSHTLTVGIARLLPSEQDEIDDFLALAARTRMDLRAALPKPATAEVLLALSRGLLPANAPAMSAPPTE